MNANSEDYKPNDAIGNNRQNIERERELRSGEREEKREIVLVVNFERER